MTDPCLAYIEAYAELLHRVLLSIDGSKGGSLAQARPSNYASAASGPCALLFAPHPDDECLTGGWPLRLRLQSNWRVVTIALTLGSNPARREERKAEWLASCNALGFEAALCAPDGLSQVTLSTRLEKPVDWQKKTEAVLEALKQYQPQIVFFPHACDAHPTHEGAHALLKDALSLMPKDFQCCLAQTEFWHPLARPDVLVELSRQEAALLLKALMQHIGEVRRNPYHLRFPAYLIDNVRRGSERVLGPGARGVDMEFAMLYALSLWKGGHEISSPAACVLSSSDDPSVPLACLL